jgi:hypothetical protein
LLQEGDLIVNEWVFSHALAMIAGFRLAGVDPVEKNG